MLRRQPIFTAMDPGLVASGVVPDAQPALRPLWSIVDGVQFVNGKVRHRREDKKLLQPELGLCRGMGQQQLSNGEKVLWFVVGNNCYRWDVFSLNMILDVPPGGLVNPYIDFTFYGDWAFVNRGVGPVQFFNGVTFDVMPQMPENVKQLQKFLSFLMAVGTGSKRTGVQWSDANDISKWVPSATVSAGSLYFENFDSGIIASAMLGSVMAVYSDSQMGIVSFIGSPFYFGKKDTLTGLGCCGPEAVTSAGLTNYGMGRQGPWVTDGESFEYIDSGKLHEYFQDNVNWAVSSKIIVARNDVLRTIDFFVPTGDSTELNEGWSFDPANGGWSPIRTVSFFHEDMIFGRPVRANPTGEVALVGGFDFNRDDFMLQTKPLLMQLQSALGLTDVHFVCKVDEVELFLKQCQNCRMRIGSSMEHNGTIHWSTYITLDVGRSTYKVPAGVPDGVYWFLEFSSVTEDENVASGADLVVSGGEQVISLTEELGWTFNLQGLLLYGAVEGAKAA